MHFEITVYMLCECLYRCECVYKCKCENMNSVQSVSGLECSNHVSHILCSDWSDPLAVLLIGEHNDCINFSTALKSECKGVFCTVLYEKMILMSNIAMSSY